MSLTFKIIDFNMVNKHVDLDKYDLLKKIITFNSQILKTKITIKSKYECVYRPTPVAINVIDIQIPYFYFIIWSNIA